MEFLDGLKYFAGQLINGLGLGSIYALIALGYSMVYGIVKLINFAHGDVIMVGGYTLLLILSKHLPLPLAIIGSIIFCMLVGLLIHLVAYKPLLDSSSSNLIPVIIAISGAVALLLYNIISDNSVLNTALTLLISFAAAIVFAFVLLKVSGGQRPVAPRISLLITAIGVSMFLQNLYQLIYGSQERSMPPMLDLPTLHVAGVVVPLKTVLNITITAIMMVGLSFLVNKTRMGKAMRATSEDPDAAKLMGINTNTTVAFTFVVGSGLASVGAFLFTNTYPNVSPTMGGMLGLKAFVAAVLGGIGNIPGAMLGAILLGIIESMTNAYISTTWVDAIVFSILIIILLVKPTGILGKNIKEKV